MGEPDPPELLIARDADVGDLAVRRLLPERRHRTVGPWCFVDTYGPHDLASGPGMQVAPHPHIGLQTVTWLIEGEILHRDSLGNTQTIRPGQLNLMSSGRGIAHSEESVTDHGARLQGVQLWVALPDSMRHSAPWFEHHPELPVVHEGGGTRTVVVGSHAGLRSPATVYSPIVGVDVLAPAGPDAHLPLNPVFEHAVVPMSGDVEVEGERIGQGNLLYLPPRRPELRFVAPRDARFLLLGGSPFGEDLVMWWNFVGRTGEEIAQARVDWEHARANWEQSPVDGEGSRTDGEPAPRFGRVAGYPGPPTAAPPLSPGRMVPTKSTTSGPTP